jgi:methionyl-tRNA formyltransferase
LIRALTRPYPGAFSWLEGTRWTVWQAALLPSGNGTTAPVEPGTVLGPLVSPVPEACGQMVACGEEDEGGKGVVALLELEQEDGTILRGRELSDQLWTGRTWTSVDAHALT